jgi:hypothetical protein
MIDLAKILAGRVSFKMSDFYMILSQFIPSVLRSSRANRQLALADEGLQIMSQALDVKRILQREQDLQYLVRQLLGRKRAWLLHQ